MAKLSLWSAVLFLSANRLICAGATPGAVDPTFDPGRGALYVSPSNGRTVLIQPDGKILVTGENNALNQDFVPAVLRFSPDGTLDHSFDASDLGVPGSYYWEYGPKVLALQPNGQILVAGWFTNPDGSARYLTRLNSDGSIDATFNPQIGNGNSPASDLEASLLAEGKILIGGNFTSVNGVARNNLARLNADGSLDQAFNAGVAISHSFRKTFVVQSTGKVVVAPGGNQIFRLNPDGSLDNAFGAVVAPQGYSAGGLLAGPNDKVIWTAIWAGGIFDCAPTIISRVTADGTSDPVFQPFTNCGGGPLLLQQDGRLIISSWYGPILRLNPDGSPDPSFRPIGLGSYAQQADGRLMLAGYFSSAPYPAGIRRLFLDGSSDNSFNPGMGLVWIRKVSIDHARLLPNGKIAIAGNFNYIDRVPRSGIAVLSSNGSVDPSFDAGTLIPLPGGTGSFNTMAVQGDGKMLLAFRYSLVRLESDGRVDPTFHYFPGPSTSVRELGIQPSGKILLTNDTAQLIRLNSDGSVDPTFSPAPPGSLVGVQPDAKILLRTNTRLIRLMIDGALDPGFNSVPGPGPNPPTFLGLQPNGMLLVGRFLDSINSRRFGRLHPDGGLDQTFDPGFRSVGLAAADLTGIYFSASLTPWGYPDRQELGRFLPDDSRDPNFSVQFTSGETVVGPSTLLIQPDGQLLVAGSFDQVNGVARAGIARLNGAAPKKLANISTRVGVSTGQKVEIGGFIITGNVPKRVIVRALGPSLGSNGVAGSETLANPSLELHDSSGAIIGHNDDWRATQEAEIMATGLSPVENAEAAIVAVLAPGQYTAVVQGPAGDNGIALTEVYDLDPASDSSLANISTRGFVNDNNGVMIGGFILRGPESSTIVARAIGPSLAAAGVTGPLADPVLELHDGDGTIIGTNDNWRENQEEVQATGLAPENDLESAFVRILPPGGYTAIVRGAGDTTGIGLVEVYHLQ
jgi:uncharacterized delta-60 repeat protein